MRHAIPARAPFAALLACLLGGASAGAAPDAGDAASGLSHAGWAAHARFAQTIDSANEGRRLYLALNCYGCHGTFAAGAIGPSIVGAPRFAVEFNVMNGNEGGMPSFAAYVGESDISNLTAYLHSIGTDHEPTFMDWWKLHPHK